MKQTFDSIRAYRDEDVPQIIRSLLDDAYFLHTLHLLPQPFQQLRHVLPQIKTISAFQSEIIYPFAKWIVQQTVQQLTFSGLDKLSPSQPYLFISNHRDIIMDPLLLNYILFNEGFPTTQIGIGNNLLIFPWIKHLVRLNKSFIVIRNVKGKDLAKEMIRLSNYIAYVLLHEHESVWIAQREGRAKDGKDETQPALLKMLFMNTSMFNAEIKTKSYHVVPVCFSYEFDPCDALKAIELYHKSQGHDHTKSAQDDLLHMKTGLFEQKGHVHIHFGEPICTASLSKTNFFQQLKHHIDQSIYSNYKLFATNLLAYTMLYDSRYQLSAEQYNRANAYFKRQKEKYQLADEQFVFLLLPYANQAKLFFSIKN